MTANKSYFTPGPRALDWITKVHRGLYRATGGLLGSTLFQMAEKGKGFLIRPMPMLLLTTIGRKSGERRTVPLPYFTYDGRTFLVGSNAGRDKHPAWYLNLLDRPEVEVQIRWKKSTRRAVTLRGEERARMWARHVEAWPRYALYQQATPREIPLVELVG
jgi:deazaflavin-dependent oxidoreductase (nitroreductase family)